MFPVRNRAADPLTKRLIWFESRTPIQGKEVMAEAW